MNDSSPPSSFIPYPSAKDSGGIFEDIRKLIEETRQNVATTVNAGLTMLYWKIGKRIYQEILQKDRAEYGAQIVSSLGRQLSIEYGRGFSEKSLRHMIRFAEAYPDDKIVSSLLRQLSWTHFLAVIYIEDPLKRDFYAEMCRIERWSTRTLQKKIDSMLFERTALSTKPEKLARLELQQLRDEDKLTQDLVFRDPYFLDFLGLKDTYLDKYERRTNEEPPIGLILCAGKKHETIELLDLEKSGIKVSSYWTEALPKEQLEKKLHEAVRLARLRLENKGITE